MATSVFDTGQAKQMNERNNRIAQASQQVRQFSRMDATGIFRQNGIANPGFAVFNGPMIPPALEKFG